MNIVLTETKDFFNSAQSYNPKFRDMPLKEIEEQEQENLQSYLNVGYNSFLFNRDMATIYIKKIEVKCFDDILKTDVFGLLND
jgi:hypothetical protein